MIYGNFLIRFRVGGGGGGGGGQEKKEKKLDWSLIDWSFSELFFFIFRAFFVAFLISPEQTVKTRQK